MMWMYIKKWIQSGIEGASEMAERVAETMSQRWSRALDRAIADGLDVLTCEATGQWFVESASRSGTVYEVSRTRCTCPAGRWGGICKHMACLLAQLGELPIDAPPALVVVVPVADDVAVAA